MALKAGPPAQRDAEFEIVDVAVGHPAELFPRTDRLERFAVDADKRFPAAGQQQFLLLAQLQVELPLGIGDDQPGLAAAPTGP